MNIGEALRHFRSELFGSADDPSLETQLIFQKATGLSRPVLLSHGERLLDPAAESEIREMIRRRKEGFPLPYLLGAWEFYGHTFEVDPSVLIPRPETELLVEHAEAWLRKHPEVHRGFDIGTGSGCIAISLLLDFPELCMTAVDIRPDTLRTAKRNAERHHCSERFFPVRASLFSAFTGNAELVCANLPYIPSRTCPEIEPAKYEPLTALDGGPDGFDLYRLLFQQLAHKITEGSLILCEIEYRQGELAAETAREYFPGKPVSILEDLAGQPRLLRIGGEKE